MKNGSILDLGMTAYDEMFMTDQERAEVKFPRIYDITNALKYPVSLLNGVSEEGSIENQQTQ